MNDARSVALVAVGGSIGTLARYGVGEIVPVAAGTFPTSTLLVNVAGCAALGVLLGLVARRWPDDTALRLYLGAGVLGGFTTFSTFAVETVQLLRADAVVTAVAYVFASVTIGLAAARLGSRLAGGTLVAEGES